MKLFKSNMQTGILVLLVVLVSILCITLFFTNKEVRNIKASVVKNKHDINSLQSLLNDVGLTAIHSQTESNQSEDYPPTSQFVLPEQSIPDEIVQESTPAPVEEVSETIPSEDIEEVKETNVAENSEKHNEESSDEESSDEESSDEESSDEE